jgi:uncharacterized protein
MQLLQLLKKFIPVFVLLACSILMPGKPGRAGEADRQTSIIGRNQFYQTRYYVFDSQEPGPVVLLEAGVHGDEIAGVYALEELLPRIKIYSGKLIVLPRMNPPAIQINRRYFNTDMNRIFPGRPSANLYEYQLAWEIYHMMQKERVEYALTLHESRNLYSPRRSKTFGQSIVYGQPAPPPLLWHWLQEINKDLDFEEKFCDYYCPQEYGASDVFVRQLRLKAAFAVETWRRLDLLRRVELQKLACLTFLKQVGMQYSVK